MAEPSTFDDLADAVTKLPWRLGLVFAVLSYLGLHALAVQPLAGSEPILLKDAPTIVRPAMVHGVAAAGQYIVPLTLSLGAGLSAYRRRHRGGRC